MQAERVSWRRLNCAGQSEGAGVQGQALGFGASTITAHRLDIARRFGIPACLSFVSMRQSTGQISAWHNGPDLPKSR